MGPATNADESTNDRELTFGEKAVGLTFNPSSDVRVDNIKRKFADAIDVLQTLRGSTDPSQGEVTRMLSVAITEAKTAQMWAVKAATWDN